MQISIRSRVEGLAHSPTLEINQRVKELREGRKHIVHLGFGESPFPPPRPVIDALKKHASDTRYLPSQGLSELREQSADYLSWRFGHATEPGRIVIGPGSKELIFDVLLALEGDLILPAPSWVSYAPQAKLLGKRVVWAQTKPGAGYRMTSDNLDCACRKSKTNQKILILNSPGNPTGSVYSKNELKELAGVCRRHNVIVISDEIYAEITFSKKKHSTIGEFCPERTLVTTGLSKGFAAGGYRLGVLSVPKEMGRVVSSMEAIASETFSCVAAPIQQAAIVAFSRDKTVREHVCNTVAIHKLAGEYLYKELVEIGLNCPKPEGAFYLFPDFSPYAGILRKKGVRTDMALCADVLEKNGVAMLPGTAFGVPARRFAVRLSTCDYNGDAVLKAYRRKSPTTASEAQGFVTRNCPNLPEAAQRIRDYLGL